ncbi:unnamed protein product [Cunninghamella blakesleeana]
MVIDLIFLLMTSQLFTLYQYGGNTVIRSVSTKAQDVTMMIACWLLWSVAISFNMIGGFIVESIYY